VSIPPFTALGLLPPGDYPLTLAELRASQLVDGSTSRLPVWDRDWRAELVENLALLVSQLQQVGITEIFVDGSFVEDKAHPGDIDGYFACSELELKSGELVQRLNALDPWQVWTWELARRRAAVGSTIAHLPMWHRYHVDLYPDYGQPSGVRDEDRRMLTFPELFRMSRRGFRPKGILRIVE
jgi:hypothetical protein